MQLISSDQTWLQVSLPFSMGALGLLQTFDITEAAYLASAIDSFHLIFYLPILSHERHLEEVPLSAILLLASRYPQLSSLLKATALFECFSSPVPGERHKSSITTKLMLSKSESSFLSVVACKRARLLFGLTFFSCSVYSSLPHPTAVLA